MILPFMQRIRDASNGVVVFRFLGDLRQPGEFECKRT